VSRSTSKIPPYIQFKYFLGHRNGVVKYDRLSSAVLYGVSVIEYNDKGKLASIEEIFIHKRFKQEDSLYKFDLSLIKTKQQLQLQPGVAEVKAIANKGVTHAPGTKCTLVGFGSTGNPEMDRVRPDRLRMVTVEIKSDGECGKHTTLLPGMLCAGSDSAGVCDVSQF
jgi:Trypsin